ncbi:response regulator [Robiginitalea biformata]|uniref:Response regulatory domain-containing protein n=1 Tax=Robiginitalea biformata (strain ATCC BAA-864 / DSM 15991 / KCTC 12146 / HTCC2501) TaxID=313596 RepID=A4CKT1_ROBBH|nr:response regulator [Robiginitalea biformata]EAR15480.1 hypothetical protein RB2501_14169 [Robiginitalea biformata HTCC2501]
MKDDPMQILLVDHNEIDLYIAQRNLDSEFRQAEILTFLDTEKAFEFLKTQVLPDSPEYRFVPDLILVEINMPQMSGPEFLNSLYGLKGGLYKKKRAYLTHAMYSDRMGHHVPKNCAGFIQKPITVERIREILQDLSSGPH